jgi:hypothetical protein
MMRALVPGDHEANKNGEAPVKTRVIAIAAAVALSSCSALDIPQTRAEFIRHPQMKKESYTVPRSLDAVVASYEKTKRCVDAEFSQTRMGGGGMVSTSRDLGDLEAQGANATKVTLHHGGGRDALVNALKEWSKGRDQTCQAYGGK